MQHYNIDIKNEMIKEKILSEKTTIISIDNIIYRFFSLQRIVILISALIGRD